MAFFRYKCLWKYAHTDDLYNETLALHTCNHTKALTTPLLQRSTLTLWGHKTAGGLNVPVVTCVLLLLMVSALFLNGSQLFRGL